MKHLKDFIYNIQEGLKLGSSKIKINQYSVKPKTRLQLMEIIRNRLTEDKDADLNDIDVSGIVSMNSLFLDLDPHNIKIDEWDVSNVEDISAMFWKCNNFNCDLSKWNVKKVESMYGTFYHCESFEGKGLEKWDVSEVKDMSFMFCGCKKFKENLDNWNVDNLMSMSNMFKGLKRKLPKWFRG